MLTKISLLNFTWYFGLACLIVVFPILSYLRVKQLNPTKRVPLWPSLFQYIIPMLAAQIFVVTQYVDISVSYETVLDTMTPREVFSEVGRIRNPYNASFMLLMLLQLIVLALSFNFRKHATLFLLFTAISSTVVFIWLSILTMNQLLGQWPLS